ncbi:MAG: phenylalanine--tRNA ligase subunit beta [Campylobacterales bacterium]
MIVTRRGLEEFVNLSGIETKDLLDRLSSIGLEVESFTKIEFPKGVVVGRVLECQKHPDATKLNLCKVDVGSETLQIVCGAKNVAKDQYVAVAKVGSILPDGLEIKKANLRGVESLGMICSSTELGLPEINDGIMVLDSSIGSFSIGDELRDIEELNDEIIELGITPNRGDCFSLYGVARDIACAYSKNLKPIEYKERKDNVLGIGRTLSVGVDQRLDSSLFYRMVEIKEASTPLKIALRLGFNGNLKNSAMDNLVEYATYISGVIMNCYKESELEYDSGDHKKFQLNLKKDKNGLDALYGKKRLSLVGYDRETGGNSDDSGVFILEASYIAPEIVSKKVSNAGLKKSSSIFFRSSRGSNPDLGMGMDELVSIIHLHTESIIYSGVHEYSSEKEPKTISIDRKKISSIIGKDYEVGYIGEILKRLCFKIEATVDSDTFVVRIPPFRHDIVSIQDIAEEILRFDGIDELPPTPLEFQEKFRESKGVLDYQKREYYRKRAALSGFSECVHYVFSSEILEEFFGFEKMDDALAISNPITNELNTLRSSLLPNMVESAKRNANIGQKTISLFEIGRVFDEKREESERVGFLFSGHRQKEAFPYPKGEDLDFFSFADMVSKSTLPFKLQEMSTKSSYMHPYMSAQIYIDNKKIGYLGRLHPSIEKKFELEKTFVAEIDFEALSFGEVVAKPFPNIQPLQRDLSFLVDSSFSFERLSKLIEPSCDEIIESFYPLDIYSDDDMGSKVSLTVRFVLQPQEKSLEDEEIVAIMDKIVEATKKEGIELR